MNNVKKLKEHKVLKEIIKDSFGGVCYMEDSSKYDTKELLNIYGLLTDVEKESLDGIIKGAINYIKIK